MDLYTQLKGKAGLFIRSYVDDLLVHDRDALKSNPGVPFLHFTGECGTHILFLTPAKDYPPDGQLYPFLFGMTDRERELDELPGVVESMKGRYGRGDLALYFDGTHLREVSHQKAAAIAHEYVENVRAAWRLEKKGTKGD